ncbi:MAG: hypothetical protein PVJ51_02155 [Acidobacteriota bacterium]
MLPRAVAAWYQTRVSVPRSSRKQLPADSQGLLFEPLVHVTRPASRHRRSAELTARVQRALRHFPELHTSKLTVGVTRSADGIAVFEDMTVRFDLRRGGPTYYCIGHELTHLLQALRLVPMGEVQCDIWTMARGRLFLDEAPYYLPLPEQLRRHWKRYRLRVSYLCARAISERPTRRQYIRWLKQQLSELHRDRVP